jgi:hypothetical protein
MAPQIGDAMPIPVTPQVVIRASRRCGSRAGRNGVLNKGQQAVGRAIECAASGCGRSAAHFFGRDNNQAFFAVERPRRPADEGFVDFTEPVN